MRRSGLMVFLLAAYVIVSFFAYTDVPREDATPPLTDRERRGLEVFRSRNCHVCHQIYGFGGFLGPDLTNRVTDETLPEEFDSLLTYGSGRMPALRLSAGDREAVVAYLAAVNRTGRSQPEGVRSNASAEPVSHLESLLPADAPVDVRRGAAVWTRSGCGSCHVPFTVGRVLAPDVTGAASDRSLDVLLREGRGRMPSFPLDESEVDVLRRLLEWVSENRAGLVEGNDERLQREGFSWERVPWFEYP